MPGGKKDRQMARKRREIPLLNPTGQIHCREDGRLTAIECIEMKLGDPDAKVGENRSRGRLNFSIAVTRPSRPWLWPDPVIGETPGLEPTTMAW